MVFRGFVTIWSLATPPTRKSPFSESATTLGSTRLPLSVGTTRGTRLRTCATQVLVVPRSMPSMGFSRAVEPAILVVLPRPSEGDVVPSPLLAIGRRLLGPPPAALEEGGHGENAARRGPRPPPRPPPPPPPRPPRARGRRGGGDPPAADPHQEAPPPLEALGLVHRREHELLVRLPALRHRLRRQLAEERDLGEERLRVIVAAGVLGELPDVLHPAVGVQELGLEVLLVALGQDDLDRLAGQVGRGRAGEPPQERRIVRAH